MFQTYFRNLQKDYLADPESSELTFRTYFQNLVSDFAKANVNRELIIKHEPTNQNGKGRPDFKVTTKEQLTIGLIETKKIGADLKKLMNSKQLANYKQLSDNIIITDYLDFYLVKKGEPVFKTFLFSEYDFQNKRYKIEQTRIDELTKLLKQFFESEPDTITKAKDLANKLSDKAIFLKDFAYENLLKETGNENLLHGLFQVFQDSLIHQITKKDFADIYSQTITYSLFLAALNCDDPKTQLNKYTAFSLLPNSFPLIKELFHRLDDFPAEIVWAIDEIISILKVTDISAIKHEFADYRHKEKGFNDPFIYFYEDFLKHYDKSRRELRGVYYTPEPVVSFIVRSIEDILKETFGIEDGFINKDVTLLDFAAGTGTFLLNCFKQAIEQAQKFGDKHTVNKILNEQIINNFYGFELLIAPYVIANLKISEYLKDQGFSIQDGKRFNIFLTDTLSNRTSESVPGFPSISKEGKLASETKKKKLLIILGNPPYSVSSQNKTGYVTEELMEKYKIAVRSEKNIQPLSDDYIKFIRFAHYKMESVERGVIGIITNNSFIDGLIHRGMRQELMKDFDEIYILNLHGNYRINEKCPDGSKDENVFDILPGIAITFLVKKSKGIGKQAKVFYKDVYGLRQVKYEYLYEFTKETIDWNVVLPEKDNFFFTKKEFSSGSDYANYKSLENIFILSTNGIKTHNDSELVSNQSFEKNNYPYSYRPFDNRFIDYDLKRVIRHRYNIMKYMLSRNYGLCVLRQSGVVGGTNIHSIYITDILTDTNLFKRGGAILFPLYVYDNKEVDENGNVILFQHINKEDNISKEFKQYIKAKYKATYTPEQILGYIYAVLHSPAYRTKYIEFLKIDFPRIPFTDNEELFLELSKAGFELIEHHLLKKSYSANICRMNGTGDNFKVEKVEYEAIKPEENPEADFVLRTKGEKLGRVWINKDRCFEPIPESIWNFYIGGYQVLEKWLKERKKHEITLSSEDIQHFIKVVNVLDYTIKAMERINLLTESWV